MERLRPLNCSSWHTTGCVPPGVAKSLAQSFTILTADSSILWLPILWIFSEEGSKLSLRKCDDETTGGSLAPRMKLKTCNLAFEAPPPPNLSSSGRAPHPRGPSLPWLWDVYSISLCLPDSLRPKSSLPSSSALRKKLKNPFFHPCIPRHSASAAGDAVMAETGARLGTTPAHVRTRVTSALHASPRPRSPPELGPAPEAHTPVIVVPVAPVLSVAAVLVVRPLPRQAVGAVAPRAVGVQVPPVPVVVVLVPVLLVLVVPVTPPGRVVTATAIAELSFPLPVASICKRTIVSQLQEMAAFRFHSSLNWKGLTHAADRHPTSPSLALCCWLSNR